MFFNMITCLILHSGFQGIYDVEHFIKTLRYDVNIVEKIPEISKNGKTKKIKAFKVQFTAEGYQASSLSFW